VGVRFLSLQAEHQERLRWLLASEGHALDIHSTAHMTESVRLSPENV
jgi:hypothetical protein